MIIQIAACPNHEAGGQVTLFALDDAGIVHLWDANEGNWFPMPTPEDAIAVKAEEYELMRRLIISGVDGWGHGDIEQVKALMTRWGAEFHEDDFVTPPEPSVDIMQAFSEALRKAKALTDTEMIDRLDELYRRQTPRLGWHVSLLNGFLAGNADIKSEWDTKLFPYRTFREALCSAFGVEQVQS